MTKPLVLPGDCREVMAELIASGTQFDSCVTDPPYHLTSIVKRFGGDRATPAQHGTDGAYARTSRGFMGKQWDGGGIAFDPELWALVFDLLKPGGYLLAFSGTRTYHRMACAIEDAGFEIRDQIGWLYGSGFPKSHNVGKAIDKAAGAVREVIGDSPFDSRKPHGSAGRNSVGLNDTPGGGKITAPASPEAAQWEGWGTALKPAWEPICVARKPLIGTVAENVLAHGTGALNIDSCRIDSTGRPARGNHGDRPSDTSTSYDLGSRYAIGTTNLGRWPANVIHDGSDEVAAEFPTTASGAMKKDVGKYDGDGVTNFLRGISGPSNQHGDSGSAARFFYSAKADSGDRLTSKHPTVKPVDLMAYLCRLVTQPGGTVLDPFAGSGTTGMAAMREGFNATLIERDPEYVKDILYRLAHVDGGDTPLFESPEGGREGNL